MIVQRWGKKFPFRYHWKFAQSTDPAAVQERKVRELENEVARLRDKLANADLISDVQKKISILLGLSTASTPNEPK